MSLALVRRLFRLPGEIGYTLGYTTIFVKGSTTPKTPSQRGFPTADEVTRTPDLLITNLGKDAVFLFVLSISLVK